MARQVWEYRSISVSYEEKKHDFAYEFAKPVGWVVGIEALCNTYGQSGWELIQILPRYAKAWNGIPDTIELIFKRPKEPTSS